MKMSIIYKVLAALTVGCSLSIAADTPEGYSQNNEDIREAARREGELVVHSVTSSVPLLVEGFQRLYPEIVLRYVSMDTSPLYDRIISEAEDGGALHSITVRRI